MTAQRHRVRMPAWPVHPRHTIPGAARVMLTMPFPGWNHSARTLQLIRQSVRTMPQAEASARPVSVRTRASVRFDASASVTGNVPFRDQLPINPGLPRQGWGSIVIVWQAVGGATGEDMGGAAVALNLTASRPDRLRLTDEQAGSLAAAMIRQAFEQVARVPGAARVEAWLWLFSPFASRLHGGIGLDAEAGRAWAWEHGVRLRGSAGANFSPDQTIYTTSEPFRVFPEIALLTPSGVDATEIHGVEYDGWPDWIHPYVEGAIAGRTRETYAASLAAFKANARELGDALREIAKHGQPRPYHKVASGASSSDVAPAQRVPVGVGSNRTVPSSGDPVNRNREDSSRWQ